MPKVLVLFSGGRDSFLTACKLAEEGKEVTLFSCSCGALTGEDRFLTQAERIINHYHGNNIKFAGVYNTAALTRQLGQTWNHKPWSELALQYPHLTNNQIRCMTCQTAMWIAAASYAGAHHIDNIAVGYKQTDVFCSGMRPYVGVVRTTIHPINILLPVWDTHNVRDELGVRGFEPQVLEPKCNIGCPDVLPSEKARADMLRYFNEELSLFFDALVPTLTRVFTRMSDMPKSQSYPGVV